MKNGKTVTLAIESSCDETAAAVLLDGREVLSNIISSQIDIHKLYGGVVPEIASRHHLTNVNTVVDQALGAAKVTMDEVDLIGVTYGPGLVGALLIGLATAKAYALAAEKPLVGVHHIQGHICANYIQHKDLKPPFMALVISGGHTNIVEVTDYNECHADDDGHTGICQILSRKPYCPQGSVDQSVSRQQKLPCHDPQYKIHPHRQDHDDSHHSLLANV